MPFEFQMLDGWRSEMQRYSYTSLDTAESALGALQGQATELISEFRQCRKMLREQAQAEVEANTSVGYRLKKIYAPLNLFSRVRGYGLELVWQEVHRNRLTGGKVYKSLRLAKDGNADLRLLLAKALPFELELVREAEAHAKRIRAQWRRWVHIRSESGRALHLADDFLFSNKSSGPSSPEGSGTGNGSLGGGTHDWVPSST